MNNTTMTELGVYLKETKHGNYIQLYVNNVSMWFVVHMLLENKVSADKPTNM